MRHAEVAGIGVWLPEQVRANDAWPAEFGKLATRKTKRELIDLIPDKTDKFIETFVEEALKDAEDPFLGTVFRRVAPDDVTSYQAEVWAGKAALEDAGLAPADIDAVLTYSTVPDKPAQTSAPKVAHELGIRGPAYTVDAGCAAPLVQLQVASALVQSGQARRVLLCQGNLAHRVVFPSAAFSPSIGDAATAIVVAASEQPGVLGLEMNTVGSEWESICWMPRNREAKHWFRDACGGWTLSTADRRRSVNLMANSIRYGVETVRTVLERCEVSVDQIDVLAATQARDWMPGKIAEGLGIPPERAPSTYRDFGSVGPCTPWLNLWTARERGLVGPGSLCAVYVQGISFTMAAALLRYRPSQAKTAQA